MDMGRSSFVGEGAQPHFRSGLAQAQKVKSETELGKGATSKRAPIAPQKADTPLGSLSNNSSATSEKPRLRATSTGVSFRRVDSPESKTGCFLTSFWFPLKASAMGLLGWELQACMPIRLVSLERNWTRNGGLRKK